MEDSQRLALHDLSVKPRDCPVLIVYANYDEKWGYMSKGLHIATESNPYGYAIDVTDLVFSSFVGDQSQGIEDMSKNDIIQRLYKACIKVNPDAEGLRMDYFNVITVFARGEY